MQRRAFLFLFLLAVPGQTQELLAPAGGRHDSRSLSADEGPPLAGGSAGPATGVIRPRFLSGARVPYPKGAAGQAVVVLRLWIDEEGSVEKVELESGMEPFSRAAAEAASEYRFEPARVDGRAKRSVILFELRFEPPRPPSLPHDVAPKVVSPSNEVAADLAAVEVSVTGVRVPGSTRAITDADTRILPGAEGDPVRAIQVLPGAVPTLISGPFIGIRGAPPGMVGSWFDGIELPYLFHLARGTAVVHPWLVESAALYAAGAPARLGNSPGGLIEATAAEPEGRLRLNGRLRLTETALGAEIPFERGKGSMMAAGRYSYTEPLVSLIAPEFALDYWDYQGKVTYAFDSRRRVELLAFGSGDMTGRRAPDDSIQEIFNGSFHRVALRYTALSGQGNRTRVGVVYGHDRWEANQSQFRPRSDAVTAHFEHSRPLSESSWLFLGASATGRLQIDQFFANAGLNTLTSFQRTDEQVALWLEWNYHSSPRTTLSLGVRADVYHSGSAPISPSAVEGGVGPRFLLSHALSRAVRLHNSFGYAAAPPSTGQRPPGRMFTVAGGITQGLLSDAGVEFSLPFDIKIDTTVYHNVYFDTGDVGTLRNLSGQLRAVYEAPDMARGQGQAYGFEVSVRRTLFGPVQGFLSYGLSRSERTIGNVRGFAEFDRTHVVDAALGYNAGRGWLISLRGTAFTGYPARVDSVELAKQPPRTQPYYQLDAQVSKRWSLERPGSYVGITLGILNATLQKETNDLFCGDDGCRESLVGPATIPTLGVEGEL